MRQIRGKTALITGASRGIGPHIARALAAQGMNLVLSARTEAALEATAEELRSLGVRVLCLAADLGEPGEVEELASRAEEESDGITVLVNNAGIEGASLFQEAEPRQIEKMIAVNLTSPLVLTRLLLPHMIRRGEGHIVNLASLAGLVGVPHNEPYSATKHGVVGFSRSLRQSLHAEKRGVSVSVICPGFVEDAGMYHSASLASGSVAPKAIGTVPIRKVSEAVVRAILNDEPEIVLSGSPMLPLLVMQTLAPRMAVRVSEMLGVPAMFKRWAEAGSGKG